MTNRERRDAIAQRLLGGDQRMPHAQKQVVDSICDNVARLLFLGFTLPEICSELTLDATTVGRVVADPKCIEKVQTLRKEADLQAVDAVVQIKNSQGEAVMVAKDIMRNGVKQRDKLTAAFGLLDRGGNGPRQMQQGGAGITISEAVAERLIRAFEHVGRMQQVEAAEVVDAG